MRRRGGGWGVGGRFNIWVDYIRVNIFGSIIVYTSFIGCIEKRGYKIRVECAGLKQ